MITDKTDDPTASSVAMGERPASALPCAHIFINNAQLRRLIKSGRSFKEETGVDSRRKNQSDRHEKSIPEDSFPGDPVRGRRKKAQRFEHVEVLVTIDFPLRYSYSIYRV